MVSPSLYYSINILKLSKKKTFLKSAKITPQKYYSMDARSKRKNTNGNQNDIRLVFAKVKDYNGIL